MFKHNLLLIFRSFKRFKSTFFINLIGLSTGMACTLAIYLWVQDELNVDKFHKNDQRLFQVQANFKQSAGIATSVETVGPLAQALANDIPEIEYAAPVAPPGWFGKSTLTVNNNNIKASGQYAGKDYFNMFSFDLLEGNKNNVLGNKKSMAISNELAMKLFGTTQNLIGKTIEFQHKKQFAVSGIFKKVPVNSSEQFDFVLSWEEMEEASPWVTGWSNFGPHTYIVMKEGTKTDQLNAKLTAFIQKRSGDSGVSLFAQQYSSNYLHGTYENGVQAGGRIEYVKLFSLIAIFILVIACINFMNLSTARASGRLKEVGMKKALGASRKSLIFQYLVESLAMTLMSLLVALSAVLLLLPQFNQLTGKQMTFHFNTNLVITLLSVIILTGIIAGSYPALYLSGFNPVKVLKGNFQSSFRELLARKGLVVFQFTLSVVLIVSVIVVYKQVDYVQTKNIGFEKEHVISFDIEGTIAQNTNNFIDAVKKIPGVVNASSTTHNMVGHNYATGGLEWPGKSPDAQVTFEGIDANYDLIETLGIQMKEGRSFSKDFGADSNAIILNEAAVTAIGLKDPVGKKVQLYRKDKEIIGVTKNFHFESLHEEVKPMFISLQSFNAKWIMVKIGSGKEKATLAKLEQFYKAYNPGFTFDYRFLDTQYQAQYVAEQLVSKLSRYFASIAILISCLGLFGLAAFTAEKRRREIGVRKVLGASISRIVLLLSKEFLQLVLLAILIAIPVAWWATNQWMQSFAYKATIQWWLFALAALMAIVIALLTVSFQAIKAAVVNPVKSLKTE